jgi:Septum formation
VRRDASGTALSRPRLGKSPPIRSVVRVQRLVPRRHSRTTAAIVVILLAGLAIAGCRADDASDAADDPPSTSAESSTRPPKPSEPKPREGSCHDLSAAQVSRAHDKQRSIRCRKPHTTQTFYVGRFELATFGDEAPDTAAVAEFVTPKCSRHFKRWVGGDRQLRTLTRAHPVWFVPSLRDIRLGARWFRCDVVVAQSETRLAELPRDTEGMLDSESALDDYGLCSRGSPERRRSKTVTCDRPHSWRAFEVIRVKGHKSDDYPSRKKLRKTATRCLDRARRELEYPLEWKYGWQPPTRTQWASDIRWGICWVPTD